MTSPIQNKNMPDLLKHAIYIATNGISKDKKVSFGAVAIRKDGTLVTSKNGSTPNYACLGSHAEIRLARKLDKGTNTVYVARVLKNGTPNLAKPCHKCENVLRSKRIKKVYYTIGPNEYGCLAF